MATYFELANHAQELMVQSGALCEQLGVETAAESIREQIEALREKELMVVVAGEARRGKSSLLNALLNEAQPLFPVDVNVCTNVVTIVRYGESETVEVYIEDPNEEAGYRIEAVAREQIVDYVSEKGNPNNYRNVKMLKATIPNELLKEGVVFVDTPGVGSLNIEHAETTYSFLPNADLLLFVSDADSGLTESELQFLKRGHQYCKNILFPLTKKDLNANYKEILEDNQKKISEVLDLPVEEVQIIPVSSVHKQRYLERGSKIAYSNSNFEALEESIWTTIARHRGEILLLPFLQSVKEELLKLMDSVAAQYQMLSSSQNVAPELVEALNQEIAALEALQGNSAEWRSQLGLFFTMLQNETSARQQQIRVDAQNLVESQIMNQKTKICSRDNYSQLVCQVNDLISQSVVNIRDQIARQVDKKSKELKQQLGLGVSVNEKILDNLNFKPAELPEVTFPPKTVADTILKKGRTIGMNSMGGTAIGSILGGFIGLCCGGPIGLLAGVQYGGTFGGVLGGAKGCVDSLGKYDELDVNTVNKTLMQYISTSVSGVSINTNNTMAELRIMLTASFDQQLKKRAKELQENAAQIQKNISLAKSEVPQKLSALKQQNEQLKQQLDSYLALEASIAALNPAEQTEEISQNDENTDGAERDKKPETAEVTYDFL